MSLVALEREHSDRMFLEWARWPPPLVDANGEHQLEALLLVGSPWWSGRTLTSQSLCPLSVFQGQRMSQTKPHACHGPRAWAKANHRPSARAHTHLARRPISSTMAHCSLDSSMVFRSLGSVRVLVLHLGQTSLWFPRELSLHLCRSLWSTWLLLGLPFSWPWSTPGRAPPRTFSPQVFSGQGEFSDSLWPPLPAPQWFLPQGACKWIRYLNEPALKSDLVGNKNRYLYLLLTLLHYLFFYII